MKNNRAALRYAKAALSISLDQGTAQALEQDMVEVIDVCNASEVLVVFLDNPVLSIETKKETIFKVFANLSEGSKRLVDLLATNNRINLLDQVAEQFIELYQVQQSNQKAIVTTAIPLTNALEKMILNKARELSSAKLTLTSIVDPSIIGGFILRIGDLQYNSSVVQKLDTLKRELTQTNYSA
jgi:F-type H+-transporting ATPase subunit delta